MQRLPTSIAYTLPGYAILFSLLLGGLLTLFIYVTAGNSSATNIKQMGELLAAELASSSMQPLIHKDTLSLQVEVSETGALPGVLHASLRDTNNATLIQSHALQTMPEGQAFTAPVILEGSKAATAEVVLDTHHFAAPYRSLFTYSLLLWLLLSLVLIAIVALTSRGWSDRILQLVNRLPKESRPDSQSRNDEIVLLETSLTPLLNMASSAPQPSGPSATVLSILSLSFRNLTRLETQLSETNYYHMLNSLDQALDFVLNLYSGSRLGVHEQTINLQFAGQSSEDDHPVRALYAAHAIYQLLKNLSADNSLNLDCAIAITSGETPAPGEQLRTSLALESQLDSAATLLKAASVGECLLDQQTGSHPALDHIALLEPLNPEQSMFRCEGLEETAETLVNRQLAFYKPH